VEQSVEVFFSTLLPESSIQCTGQFPGPAHEAMLRGPVISATGKRKRATLALTNAHATLNYLEERWGVINGLPNTDQVDRTTDGRDDGLPAIPRTPFNKYLISNKITFNPAKPAPVCGILSVTQAFISETGVRGAGPKLC
jgi:hypothetical protein